MLLNAACGGSGPANDAGNANNANANIAGHGTVTTKTPEAETINNAPTLGPVVQQFYEALRDKDDAKLKETITADFQKQIEDDMKSQNEKSIAAFVAKTDYRPGQTMETRNERIQGNKGQAEIRGGAYKNWTAFTFTLENGRWRFDGGSPEIENMPKSNSNSPH